MIEISFFKDWIDIANQVLSRSRQHRMRRRDSAVSWNVRDDRTDTD